MSQLREHWEGASLSGDYTLEHWLSGDNSAAFFQTSLASRHRAVVKLIPERLVDGAAQLELWRRTRELRHPNLIELLDFGRANHGGESAVYAVFESPDDTLASPLSQSSLTSEESREVLDTVIDALRYLHAEGLAHGEIDPDHIVAVGDRIKLSTDGLREADASSRSHDVLLLGELWQQAFMPAFPNSQEIVAHATETDPQARWSLAEIRASLETPPPAAEPEPAAAEPAEPESVSSPAPVSVTPVAVRDDAPSLPPPHRRSPDPEMPKAFPKWPFAAAAGVVALILGLNLSRSSDVPAQPPVASVSLPAPSPVPPPMSKTAVPKFTPTKVPDRSAANGDDIWRVIAFTYRTADAAAKKVKQLNQHHPNLNATVFSPRGKSGYYLVSLGGRMTREEAVRLQRSARGKGLPRDLYVQNYSQ